MAIRPYLTIMGVLLTMLMKLNCFPARLERLKRTFGGSTFNTAIRRI